METRDFNGSGRWAAESVKARYLDYAARLDVANPTELEPTVHTHGDDRWIYPIMESVIKGIRGGDIACAAIGVEYISEDRKFPFGASLKARTARALRQTELPQRLKTRIRSRIARMLRDGNVPREFREYAKLLRKIGFQDYWPKMAANPPSSNEHAMRYFRYFEAIVSGSPAVVRREPSRAGQRARNSSRSRD